MNEQHSNPRDGYMLAQFIEQAEIKSWSEMDRQKWPRTKNGDQPWSRTFAT